MGRYLKTVLAFCMTLNLCTSQSTLTASVTPICTGCNVNADVLTSRYTSWFYGNPATGTPILWAELYFTAYCVTTTSSAAGSCVEHTSSSMSLIDAYVVSVPSSRQLYAETYGFPLSEARLYPSEAQDEYSEFLGGAYSSFYAFEGLEGCTATLPSSQSVPTYLGQIATASATALPSVIPTVNSVPVRHIRSTQIIIVSVVVPTAGLTILMLGIIIIRRYRKKRSQAAFANYSETTSNTQPYMDQKAELEDEERRKHELEATEIRYEMEGEDKIFEMPGNGNAMTGIAPSNNRQELRGAEHSRELEVPGNFF